MEKLEYKILKTTTGLTYNLPIFLGQGIKDLGQMIGFVKTGQDWNKPSWESWHALEQPEGIWG